MATAEYQREWRVANLETARGYDKTYRGRHPEKVKEKQRRKQRDLTPEQRAAKVRRASDWAKANPERVKAAQERRRLQWRQTIDDYKIGKGCVDCGYNANPHALQFDHRDPSIKKFNISHRACVSEKAMAVVWDEIAKCDVRCANCHSIRTWGPDGTNR